MKPIKFIPLVLPVTGAIKDKRRDRVSNDLVNDASLLKPRKRKARYNLMNCKLRFRNSYGCIGNKKGKCLQKHLPFSVFIWFGSIKPAVHQQQPQSHSQYCRVQGLEYYSLSAFQYNQLKHGNIPSFEYLRFGYSACQQQ